MLEFEGFKVESIKNSNNKIVKFEFSDNELVEDELEDLALKLNEYEIYLEYDCKGEFILNFKKEAIIDMLLTLPSRKVPEDKKELEEFINRHVVDFNEYYKKIRNIINSNEDNIIENI